MGNLGIQGIIMDRPIAGGFLCPPHCHFDENRSAAKRKALLNFLFPLEGNAAKRQRVYEGKHTSNTLLLFYAGPNSTDLEAHSSMVQAIMTQTAPRPAVISTAVEKSHALTAQVELWTEISGLKVSIAFIYLYPHTVLQPRSR